MNTNDEKIQWHPAFDAALQIEFGEEAEYLEFDSEHLLSKKPMQIDVLIKNEKHVKIQKNFTNYRQNQNQNQSHIWFYSCRKSIYKIIFKNTLL